MKKNILSFAILAVICIVASSCSSDNSEPISIEGTWSTLERTLDTNYPELDKEINRDFKEDSKIYNIERTFKDGKATTIAKRIEDGYEVRRKTESFTIAGDTLIIDLTTKAAFMLSRTRLTTTRKITRADLIPILSEIGIYDPNLLPSDIEGELRMMEVR
ncbi:MULTISPECIES: hypothetical protein [unclassified Dysgonomonas]|uniref:hypothetical protein n=1 Tax=unclassified Dysgonomonas TaxID=2630389 RepID=UPI0013ED73B7|nr:MULTISPECIES: hypothetical protein [unclassified Dysgonomonas]